MNSYAKVCQRRYTNSKRKSEAQLLNEIKWLEAMQPNAHSAMRFHRQFAITTFWPPLHTRKQIEWTLNNLMQKPPLGQALLPSERRRLQYLLAQ